MKLFILWLTPAVAFAAGTTNWDDFSVHAHLDAQRRLQIVERQTIRFDGDVNGGFRQLNLRPGQSVIWQGAAHIADDGTPHAMIEGDTNAVDHFTADGTALRWRARLPSDPPFANAVRTYELSYTLTHVLHERDGVVTLDPDFAFANRQGTMRHATVDFSWDSTWQALGDAPTHLERNDLPAGETLVGHYRFAANAANAAGDVAHDLSRTARAEIAGAALIASALLLLLFWVSQSRAGRFGALPQIDRAWLGTFVFQQPAEVVGAIFAHGVGASAVAAMLARLVQEKKIDSEVQQSVLHMRLKQPLASFTANERTLLDVLFQDRQEVTTTELHARFAGSGFDPAGYISPWLKPASEDRGAKSSRGGTWMLPVALSVTAGVLLFFSAKEDGMAWLVAPLIASLAFIAALFVALVARFSVRVSGIVAALFALTSLPAALVFYIFGAEAHFALLAGSATLSLAGLAMALAIMRPRASRERWADLRNFSAAKKYFATELAQKTPALDDAWRPYLLALGLGKNVSRWFASYGAAAAATQRPMVGTGGGPSTGTFFGGGGAFGGGGSSGSWESAVTGFSSGVASPAASSSSSSSSSSGSQGTSGGGSGGGW